jgi:hypothetical protein
MPPIMGAAAFVMAEFLAVPYSQVVIWAIIPAILYYVACFAAVHFEAKRRGIAGVPRSELPKLGIVVAERGHLFLPILILPVNKLFFISPRGDMIHSTGIFDTQRASHSRTLSDDLTKVKHYRPDPKREKVKYDKPRKKSRYF